MSAILSGELLLTELDRARLLKLNGGVLPDPLMELLEEATVVPSPAIPQQVVTMYSQVAVSHGGGDAPQKLTLCYPSDAEPMAGFISVLSPVGSALLGREAGTTVDWTTPAGVQRRMTIDAILFQPEASGDYST
ncbi:MAG: transcription elongation factor GreAB [Comamonadaceae bacterium]|jgi:regulator of nucleoside diphosphate kinase|nr:transcription elongation factor GreAB [Comamonadaceae bacterium]